MGLQVASSNSERGATLMELTVAMMIIAVALIPTSAMWLKQAQAGRAITHLSQAHSLCVSLIESSFRNQPFLSQVATSGTDPSTGFTYTLEIIPLTATRHGGKLSVTEPGSPAPLLSLYAVSAK